MKAYILERDQINGLISEVRKGVILRGCLDKCFASLPRYFPPPPKRASLWEATVLYGDLQIRLRVRDWVRIRLSNFKTTTFSESSLFDMLVISRESRNEIGVIHDNLSLRSRIEKSLSYSILYSWSDLKVTNA